MEDQLNHLDLSVSRISDIRTVLFVWDEILTMAEGEGYTPGQILRSLNVRVSLPGWISQREIALTLSAPRSVLDNLVEALPGEGLDVKQLWGFRGFSLRCRLSPRPP
jgi:hypothetical protein